mmetsp:Transcript_72495/g.196045  ORF Transcript_72495/g.196045 Transcript_72495/m.196045 type:complete len:275 (-) Transcript_72495:22-846(-)
MKRAQRVRVVSEVAHHEDHSADGHAEGALHAHDLQGLDRVLAHDPLLVHEHRGLEDLGHDAEGDAEPHVAGGGRLRGGKRARRHEHDTEGDQGDSCDVVAVLPPPEEHHAHRADEDHDRPAAHLGHGHGHEREARAEEGRRHQVAAARDHEDPLRNLLGGLRLLPGAGGKVHGQAQHLTAHHQASLQPGVVEGLPRSVCHQRDLLHVLELQHHHVHCAHHQHEQHEHVQRDGPRRAGHVDGGHRPSGFAALLRWLPQRMLAYIDLGLRMEPERT